MYATIMKTLKEARSMGYLENSLFLYFSFSPLLLDLRLKDIAKNPSN